MTTFTLEYVIENINQNQTEVYLPLMKSWLDQHNLSYVLVLSGLLDCGWKLDPTTRTIYKSSNSDFGSKWLENQKLEA